MRRRAKAFVWACGGRGEESRTRAVCARTMPREKISLAGVGLNEIIKIEEFQIRIGGISILETVNKLGSGKNLWTCVNARRNE